eukprot:CAMPEP_0185845572 /NCGR_PEP_ID=MMETSP1354-20130828/1499_1 /TAXON_ID=708628 /ORGANISM="Erythrolobus madagascarensis, Strain CCMP3276" /LENGTH=74 /DNA_ID=CAMNT_0028545559 /DNA_START=160 /DNA_END=384 /DNA_ORIENTATION=-
MGNAIGVKTEDDAGNPRSAVSIMLDPAAICLQPVAIENFNPPEPANDAAYSEDSDEPRAPEADVAPPAEVVDEQ